KQGNEFSTNEINTTVSSENSSDFLENTEMFENNEIISTQSEDTLVSLKSYIVKSQSSSQKSLKSQLISKIRDKYVFEKCSIPGAVLGTESKKLQKSGNIPTSFAKSLIFSPKKGESSNENFMEGASFKNFNSTKSFINQLDSQNNVDGVNDIDESFILKNLNSTNDCVDLNNAIIQKMYTNFEDYEEQEEFQLSMGNPSATFVNRNYNFELVEDTQRDIFEVESET
ncbi:hypothetical protein BB559_001956, partial [Furculomyces boomerangus]